MLFPLPSTWKMIKDAPNHVSMNIIGLAQTSRERLEYDDVPIFLVVFKYSGSPTVQCDPTGIQVSTF